MIQQSTSLKLQTDEIKSCIHCIDRSIDQAILNASAVAKMLEDADVRAGAAKYRNIISRLRELDTRISL